MRELISYSCSTCGGALTVDRNHKVYDCPFCGNAYDYVQMHHDELINDVKINMSQMEFSAAKEKFYTILESRPQDFEALRGIVLCDANLKSVESLRKLGSIKRGFTDKMQSSIRDVIKRAGEAEKPYFDKILQLTALSKDYDEILGMIDRSASASKNEFKRIVNVDRQRELYNEAALDSIKDMRSILSSYLSDDHPYNPSSDLIGMVVMAVTFTIIAYIVLGFFWSILVGAALTGIIAGMVILIKRKDEKKKAVIRARLKKVYDRQDALFARKEAIEKEYKDAY
ncbi:MAG: phage holin family protein, partial [Butyrivibrio sp.]|nr:phage holin family protein [Butyrivibrio sp.]